MTSTRQRGGRFGLVCPPSSDTREAVDSAKKTATFDVIYVNGDHAVQNAAVKSVDGAPQFKVRQIENEFLEKMFAES